MTFWGPLWASGVNFFFNRKLMKFRSSDPNLKEIKQNVTAFLYMIEDLEDDMITPEDVLDVLKIVKVSIESYISKAEYGEEQEQQKPD